MPRPLFSALLGEVLPGSAGATTFGPVPDGYVWDVRDVVAMKEPGSLLSASLGFQITDAAGVTIAALLPTQATTGPLYHLELRQVLVAGDEISVVTADDGWSIRITGYVLTVS